MKKLIILILCIMLSANSYAVTQQDVRKANIQPYLRSFIKHVWIFNQEKIINNRLIIAESTYQGDIYFYNSPRIKMTDAWLEDVLRHEVGHIVYWRLGLDPDKNSEELAEKFKIMSKDAYGITDLIYEVYWRR